MKIQTIATPMPVQSIGESASQQAAKARAIAAFAQPEAKIVQNQTQVSVEEMGAIVPQKTQEEDVQEMGHSDDTEVTESESVPEVKEEAKPSPQLLALARRERALRAKAQQQDQAFKAREAALAAREGELTAKGNQYNENSYIQKDKLKANPLLALQEAGLSYDDVVQAALNQQAIDPRVEATISKLEAKIRQLEEANETSSKNVTAQQQAAYDSAVKQIKADTKKLVFTDPNFETVKATNSVNDVVELIEETYRKDGTLLSVEEAAQLVEDYLVEEAMKLTKISKISKRLQTPAQAPKAQVQTRPQPKQPQPQMKTLTNANSSTRQLSAKDRAILAFKGELKS